MRQEEADHLPAGVGSARVRVGATGAAARPSMARTVQDPLLKDLPVLFFWPMRASSANQTSMAAGSTPFSRPISSRRAGKLF